MKTHFLEKFLTENACAIGYLSAQLDVVSGTPLFRKFLGVASDPHGRRIAELLPEVVGLETLLADMIAGKQSSFLLQNIHREQGQAERYVDISFYPTGDAGSPLACIIQDVTSRAVADQQLIQQQNEIRLLSSLLTAQDDYLSNSILGSSPQIENIKRKIQKISAIPSATILIHGESGTGKSMIARVIHHDSQKSASPFVEINCAAIPEALLESELFGYEKGAFTGAIKTKAGLLEEADGGTLFLDEISELPLKLQAKLLSFLETRRFRRLGSNEECEVRIRLISATHRNLNEMVEKGEFRQDLFYRLNVVSIDLPPLRDLGEDIVTIAENFVAGFNRDFNKQVKEFTPAARHKLMNYHWPGNVRELRNAVERAMIFAESEMLDAGDLHLGALHQAQPSASPLERFRLPAEGLSFEEIEKKLLKDALQMAAGNQSRAAKLLRLSRDAFRYRLEKHSLI